MSEAFRRIGTPAPGDIVLVSDHASNRVPEDIPLGIGPDLLDAHIAWDIGVAGVAERLARRHGIAAHLGDVSRLVVDLHREVDHPALIPEESDGHLIPGNIGADRAMRIERFYRPYHEAMADWLDAIAPRLIISLHSFTPVLQSRHEERPWEVGLLYNRHGEAAAHAMRLLSGRGVVVGDNQPYSGRDLNATMNRHAEAYGRPYLAVEIRNDLIANEAGQARWAEVLAQVAGVVADRVG